MSDQGQSVLERLVDEQESEKERRYRIGYCSGYVQAAADVEVFIEEGLDVDTIRRVLQHHEGNKLAQWAAGNCEVMDSPPALQEQSRRGWRWRSDG